MERIVGQHGKQVRLWRLFGAGGARLARIAAVLLALAVVSIALDRVSPPAHGSSTCTESSTAVAAYTGDIANLVADCTALLGAKDTLRGTATLDWSADLAMASWTGVTVAQSYDNDNEYRVTRVVLVFASLDGSIPAGLGSLSALDTLGLYGNALTGTIPKELGSISLLQQLDLRNNKLTGSIPKELGSLANLWNLNLSDNKLSGSIPVELGSLSNLSRLQLQQNQLSGSIPTQLGSLSKLVYLVLYDNQLTGSIPTQLGNLSKLKYLLLNDNQLSGGIPSELGSASKLVRLYVDTNALTGSVPAALASLSQLQILELCCNKLGGAIPAGFASISSLTKMTVYGNAFTADDVPKSLKGVAVEEGTCTNVTPPPRSLPVQAPIQDPPKPTATPTPKPIPTPTPQYSPGDPLQPTPTLTVAEGRLGDNGSDGGTTPGGGTVPGGAPAPGGARWPPGALAPQLTVLVTGPDVPVREGVVVLYTIELRNTGPVRLTHVVWWSATLGEGVQGAGDGILEIGESVFIDVLIEFAKGRTPAGGLTAVAAGDDLQLPLPALLPWAFAVSGASLETGAVGIAHVSAAAPGVYGPEGADECRAYPYPTVEKTKTIAGTAPGKMTDLRVAMAGQATPSGTGHELAYTVRVTNAGAKTLTGVMWQSDSLGVGWRKLGAGELAAGESVYLSLRHGPFEGRFTTARYRYRTTADGKQVWIEAENVPWPDVLPFNIVVGSNQTGPVLARHVAALAPPLALPPPDETDSDGRAVRVWPVVVKKAQRVTGERFFAFVFNDWFDKWRELYRTTAWLLYEPGFLTTQVEGPGAVADGSVGTMTVCLVVAVPKTGEGDVETELEPQARVAGVNVKLRDVHEGGVRLVLGSTVTVVRLEQEGAAVARTDESMALRARLIATPMPRGVAWTEATWARWDERGQRWQPVETREEEEHRVGYTDRPGRYAVIADVPAHSRDVGAGARYFYATGKTVVLGFLKYFDANGGLARFGYPLTDEYERGGVTVQYFERARLEYHPPPAGTPGEGEVRLGDIGAEYLALLGAELTRAAPPVGPDPPSPRYYAETGHWVAWGFLKYFDANGGVERFGYPLTEEVHDVHVGRTVQYFEKARLEWNAAAGRTEESGELTRALLRAGDPLR